MASNRVFGLVSTLRNRGLSGNAQQITALHSRGFQTVGTSLDGTVPAKPRRPRLSFTKVSICIFAGIFVGQLGAKKFAAFMEETELFVPDDDDD